MRRRAWPWFALAWGVVVVVVATATWWVIDAAGRDVLSGPSSLDDVTATASAAPTTSATGGPRPTPTPRPSASPSSGPGEPSRTAEPTPTLPSPTRTQSPTPPPAAVTRSWHGAAGTLVTQCQGGRIAFKGASPADGYSLEIEERGPQRVEVTFRRGGADESEVRVRSRCEGGVPTFDVEDDGGDEPDDD